MPEAYLEPLKAQIAKACGVLVAAEDALLAALASSRRDNQRSSVTGEQALEKLAESKLAERISDLVQLAELGSRLPR